MLRYEQTRDRLRRYDPPRRNSAAAAAGRGCEAVCFDADTAVIAKLKSGSCQS